MDGLNVNLKFLQLIQQDREENQQHRLIGIGSCGLHTIHNSVKTGGEQTDWKMKKILKAAYQREEKITLLSLVPISFLHHFVLQSW